MKYKTDHFSFILKPSTIKNAGVGVFALHDIAEGTHMALFSEGFQEEIRKPEDIPKELRGYCIIQKDGTLLCPKYFNKLDIGNYLNHSEAPNIKHDKDKGYFALRDIKVGEEIFADYRELEEPEDKRESFYK
jgi:SET domain-containing protein